MAPVKGWKIKHMTAILQIFSYYNRTINGLWLDIHNLALMELIMQGIIQYM